MGRCYEFGVSIDDSCGHAMVVSPEGGACVCGACGAACTGRFKGCDAILAMPGHVPVAAPQDMFVAPAGNPVSLRGVPEPAEADLAPATHGHVPREGAEAVEVVADLREELVPAPLLPHLAEVVDLFETLLDRPDRSVELMSQLRHELAIRDGELAQAFERLTAAHTQIADELAAERASRERLIEVVGQLAERLGQLEDRLSRPLFLGLRQREA